MALNIFLERLAYGKPRPNNYTRFLGDQIKKAREETKMSQQDLAEFIFKRQATVSDIENGKGEVDASTLALLAHVFNKPLGYFYPPTLYEEIKQEDLTPLENEMLILFRQIWDDNFRRVVINQIRTFAEFDPSETLLNSIDLAITEKQNRARIETSIRRKQKKNNITQSKH